MNAPDKSDPLEKIPTLMDYKKASNLAESLKKDDAEWDYKVVPSTDGLFHIEVFDETGFMVGKL